MKITIGSDHAGYDLKEKIKKHLKKKGHAVKDVGSHDKQSVDYPDYAKNVSLNVKKGGAQAGILVCKSGIGMAIAANKVKGIRAAPVTTLKAATLSRKHNNSNILCMGSGLISEKNAIKITDMWLASDFEGGRHERRINKIKEMER